MLAASNNGVLLIALSMIKPARGTGSRVRGPTSASAKVLLAHTRRFLHVVPINSLIS